MEAEALGERLWEEEREGLPLAQGEGVILGEREEVPLVEGVNVGDTPVGVELEEILGDLEEDPVTLGEVEGRGDLEGVRAPLEDGVPLAEEVGDTVEAGDLLLLGLWEGVRLAEEHPVEDIQGVPDVEGLGDLVVEKVTFRDREGFAEAVEDTLALMLPEPLGEAE